MQIRQRSAVDGGQVNVPVELLDDFKATFQSKLLRPGIPATTMLAESGTA